MRTVTEKDYYTDLTKFIAKHGDDWSVDTSAMENNKYTKYYTYADGAQFIVINEMDEVETIETSVVVHGITVNATIEVPLIRHEYWSTDDSHSKYWFEKR